MSMFASFQTNIHIYIYIYNIHVYRLCVALNPIHFKSPTFSNTISPAYQAKAVFQAPGQSINPYYVVLSTCCSSSPPASPWAMCEHGRKIFSMTFAWSLPAFWACCSEHATSKTHFLTLLHLNVGLLLAIDCFHWDLAFFQATFRLALSRPL